MPQIKSDKAKSTIHTSEVIYKGRQFSFIKEHITLPHRVEAEMAFVKHPGSTVIVPLFHDQTIGVIKQFRHVINDYIYEIPAGTMDPATVGLGRSVEGHPGAGACDGGGAHIPT